MNHYVICDWELSFYWNYFLFLKKNFISPNLTFQFSINLKAIVNSKNWKFSVSVSLDPPMNIQFIWFIYCFHLHMINVSFRPMWLVAKYRPARLICLTLFGHKLHQVTSVTMRTADWLTACEADLFNDQPSIGWHNG